MQRLPHASLRTFMLCAAWLLCVSPAWTMEVLGDSAHKAAPNTASAQDIAAAPWSAAAQRSIADSKITNRSESLKSFARGNGQGHFIVSLRPPADGQSDYTAAIQGNAEDAAPLRIEERKAVRRQSVRATRDAALAGMSGLPRDTLRHVYDNIYAFSVAVTPEQLDILLQSPDVLSVEPVFELEAHLAQGIPLEAGDNYRSLYNGQGLSIAICDTGINYTHPLLGNGTFPNAKVIGGYDVGQSKADPMDGNGHGTACAGITAGPLPTVATGDYIGGLAYNAKLYALKITSSATGGSATTAAMVAAWDWCVTHQNDNAQNPIMIISTSFGGGKYGSTCDTDTPAMTSAAANAVAAGMTLFVSSGNDGYCDSVGWPSCISYVNAVGAVYDAAFGQYTPCISADSCAPTKLSTGDCTSGYYATDNTQADMVTSYSNSASMVSLYAPSNKCYTIGLGSSYDTSFGGTSAACPYAAGAAAALQSAAKARMGAWLTPAQVKTILTASGDMVTDAKSSLARPRVNLKNAIDTLHSAQTLNDGLVAQYRFNGNAQDATGFANNGTVYGATPATDRFGSPIKAYRFNGTSDYIRVPSSPSLNMRNKLSISFWAHLPVLKGGIVSKLADYTAGNPGYVAFFDSASYPTKMSAGVQSASPTFQAHSTANVGTSGWNHWVVVYDGASMSLYRNGVLDSNIAAPGVTNMYNASDLYLGRTIAWDSSLGAAAGYMQGSLDDIRIYSRNLTASEVRALYASERANISLAPAILLLQ